MPARGGVPSREPRAVAALLLAGALAACGGGGGVTVAPSNDAPGGNAGGATGADSRTDGGSDDGSGDDGGGGATSSATAGGGSNGPSGGGGSGGGDGFAECSVPDVNRWIDARMRDAYLYAERVPTLDLAPFDDSVEGAARLVEALRVAPDAFSRLGERDRDERQFVEGYRTGLGLSVREDAAGTARVRRVRAGSPAERAGLVRGDRVLALDGVPAAEIGAARWTALETVNEAGVTHGLRVRRGEETPRDITLTSAEYYFYTADKATWHERDGTRIGYLSLSAFQATTAGELDQQIDWLNGQSIDELIVDLRYNPGGVASVARRFAAQLVGGAYAGEPFVRRRFNARYAGLDGTTVLEPAGRSLDLPRFVALVTEETAAAAESLVNGLEPYVDVVVIGARTRGQPFTSIPESYCEVTLYAMNAIGSNAAGVSVAGGIAPDCAVEDEFLHQQEDARDALTAAALDYLTSGVCPGGG